MDIFQATRSYEAWLSQQTNVIAVDLRRKHRFMAEAPFPFLRATFYRWLQLWPEVCKKLAKAPVVLAVGDLHVENFGTWRDSEGRLVWGINDFDECAHLPYALDLVRLATSALFATTADRLAVKPRVVCEAIAEGYLDCLEHGGRPFVLEEAHSWMRLIAIQQLKDPRAYWMKLTSWPTAPAGSIPRHAQKHLEAALPGKKLPYRVVLRQAGLGSRGHQRFVAIADWCGAKVAREAKALVPSAICWLEPNKGHEIHYDEILARSVRTPDPTFDVAGSWLIRRLAPDCSKISLADLPQRRNEERMLYCMGWETANVHLGSRKRIDSVSKHLDNQKGRWLFDAAKAMYRAIRSDWEKWAERVG